MLFIDDDEAKFLPRQEQCRARAHHDPRLAGGHAAPHAFPFAWPHIGMPLRRFAAESGFDTGQKRLRQRDLGQQQQDLRAARQRRRHRFEINFRLAGTGDAIKQHHLVGPRRDGGPQNLRRRLLILGQGKAPAIEIGRRKSPQRRQRYHLKRTVLGHGLDHAGADPCGFRQFRRPHGKAFPRHLQNPCPLRCQALRIKPRGAIGHLLARPFECPRRPEHHAQHISGGLEIIGRQPVDEFPVDLAHGRHVETFGYIAQRLVRWRLALQTPHHADHAARPQRHQHVIA